MTVVPVDGKVVPPLVSDVVGTDCQSEDDFRSAHNSARVKTWPKVHTAIFNQHEKNFFFRCLQLSFCFFFKTFSLTGSVHAKSHLVWQLQVYHSQISGLHLSRNTIFSHHKKGLLTEDIAPNLVYDLIIGRPEFGDYWVFILETFIYSELCHGHTVLMAPRKGDIRGTDCSKYL